MKIVEILQSLGTGGAERFTVDLCNELAKKNDVSIITLFPLKDNLAFYKDEVSSQVAIYSINKRLGFDLKAFKNVFNLIKELNPDVVQSHLSGIIYTFLPSLFHRKPLYVHTIHSEASREANVGIVGKYIRKISFRFNNIIPITISQQTLYSFEKYYGYSCPMIFNGRDVDAKIVISDSIKNEIKKYKHSPNTRIIVNLARIFPVKRQQILAKVSKKLQDEGFDFSVLVIGLKYDHHMIEEIEKVNCTCFFMLGEKHNPLEYLKLADAFALCSSMEGMPMSIIEALGVGTIPVCTPVGGIKDIVKNGVNGFLSEDISENSYYRALKNFLLTSNARLHLMEIEALKSYTPYSMIECAANYEKLFEDNLKK